MNDGEYYSFFIKGEVLSEKTVYLLETRYAETVH